MTRRVRWLAAAIVAVTVSASTLRAEIQPDYVMLTDPAFEYPESPARLPEGILPLWLEALKQPDSEIRLLAADAIATARGMGFEEMDTARPALVAALGESGSTFEARSAIAKTLVALDSRDAAAALFKATQEDPRLRTVIEPALAEWGFPGIRDEWRKRIENPAADRRELVLALRCVGQVRDAEALKGVLAVVSNLEGSPDVRLAAAKAAGEIAESGLETLAGDLAPDPGAALIDRLCAVSLLTRHRSEKSQEILTRMSRDPEPSIAAAALRDLHGIDPSLVLPLAEEAMANRDANVRLEGIRCYAVRPTPERIAVFGKLLDDPHPRNRAFVREELYRLAQQAEFDAAVRDAAMASLAAESWRGQEQAALLLGALDHKPAGERLVVLLDSTRPEVMAATAWALKKLAIPETLPGMLDKATRQTKARPTPPFEVIDPQLAHLFEAFALMNYKEAVPVLRQYVPKGQFGEIARSAAIWALGHLLKDAPDEQLAAALMQRFMDTAGMTPEYILVRRMSAISIGRMKVRTQLPQFHKVIGEAVDHASDDYAAAWVIEQLTDEKLPRAPILDDFRTGWFLEPAPPPAP